MQSFDLYNTLFDSFKKFYRNFHNFYCKTFLLEYFNIFYIVRHKQ